MGSDINWIWPLHELKYGMMDRNGVKEREKQGQDREKHKHAASV